ncbi:MAG: hypothetical protein HKN57_10260 [Xanthomonadales bacterium]|nr:zinc-dependent metalloprotease [Gammaproteobacteria bacterium]NND57628.1 hypothetical protein [Xanthomonadales bacterium]NNK52720.1 hypothetical protein [Xanthomonadales bacterium]
MERLPVFVAIAVATISLLFSNATFSAPSKKVDIKNLPQGRFKQEFESLPVLARARAEQALAAMGDIPEKELNSLSVGKAGDIAYADYFISMDDSAAEVLQAIPSETEPLAPLGDTFKLHSKPGTSKVLFLDFDGHTTSKTPWNDNYTNGRSFKSEPFDRDGNPRKFSDSERIMIQHIWQRVAEDFYPFDVNVTTEDPGKREMSKAQRQRAVISETCWIDSGCPGGIGYLNSFTWIKKDAPVFAFVRMDDRNTAGVVSHELGHTFGLYHAGTNSREYYSGHGSGPLAWVPIMGLMYNRSMCQWTKGEYYNVDLWVQDETAQVASRASGWRLDDHGDSPASATFLAADGTNVMASGFIGTQNDHDAFQFSTGAGTISLLVDPYNAGSDLVNGANLDVQATLYDAAGNVIAVNNVPNALYALIDQVTVPAGTYYLEITGVGAGDPLVNPPTGYTEYGSMGRYTVLGELAQ